MLYDDVLSIIRMITGINYRRHLAIALAVLALNLLSMNQLNAEVWKCSGIYTNNREGKANCQPIQGSKVCGSEGNKYFAPRRMSGTTEGDCATSGKKTSPLVDMEWAKKVERQRATSGQLEEKRRVERADAQTSSDGPAPSQLENSLGDALNKIGEALGSEQ